MCTTLLVRCCTAYSCVPLQRTAQCIQVQQREQWTCFWSTHSSPGSMTQWHMQEKEVWLEIHRLVFSKDGGWPTTASLKLTAETWNISQSQWRDVYFTFLARCKRGFHSLSWTLAPCVHTAGLFLFTCLCCDREKVTQEEAWRGGSLHTW